VLRLHWPVRKPRRRADFDQLSSAADKPASDRPDLLPQSRRHFQEAIPQWVPTTLYRLEVQDLEAAPKAGLRFALRTF
jgi:hypothetical protein